MTAARRIAKNAGIMFIGENATKVLSIILVFLIARLLGDVDYGKFTFALSFTGLFYMLIDFGTRLLLVREIAQNKDKIQKIISNVFTLKLITGILVYIILNVTAFLLGYDNVTLIAISIAGLGIMFESMSATLFAIYQAHERMDIPVIAKILRVIVRFAITVPILLMGGTFMQVLIAAIFVQFLDFLFQLIVTFRLYMRPALGWDLKYMFSLLKRSLPFLLAGVFVSVYFRIDVTMMSKMAPTSLPGVYTAVSRDSAAYNVLDGISSVPIAAIAALLPVAIIFRKESGEKLLDLFRTSSRYLTYLSIPMAVGVSMLAEKIVLLIYKDAYINSVPAMIILSWTIIPLSINYVMGTMMVAVQKEKEVVAVLMGNVIINIILNIFLIPRLSLYGAAMTTVLTEVFYLSGYYFLISREVGKLDWAAMFVKPSISAAVMALVLSTVDYHLFLMIPIGVVTYFGSMFALRAFTSEDIDLLRHLVKR